MMEQLAWGIGNLPDDAARQRDDARAVWGCRAIVTPTGRFDFVPDRIDSAGDSAALIERMGLLLTPIDLSDKARTLPPDEARSVYHGNGLHVWARMAGGYCYVTAWLDRTFHPGDKVRKKRSTTGWVGTVTSPDSEFPFDVHVNWPSGDGATSHYDPSDLEHTT